MPPKKRSRGSASNGTSKRTRTDSSSSPAFQALAPVLLEEPSVNDLHDCLRNTADGLAILSHFKRYGSLNHSMRDELSARVIFGELNKRVDSKISTERFQELASEIKELFPTESEETWCLVEKCKGKLVVSGRLKHKFYNIRRLFIKVGLISNSHLTEELEQDEGLGNDIDLEFKDDDDMLWLFTHSGPYLELSAKWAATVEQRKLLQRSISIHEYVNKFPCLKQQHGWEMLTVEWETANPLNKDADWPLLLKFIEQELKKTPEGKLLLEDSETEGEKLMTVLSNFSLIFRTRTLPKSTGVEGTWRPSKVEVQDAFFLHIKKIVELREKLETRKESLRRFKLTLQPFVCVVGNPNKIEQCLVVVDDTQWVASSPLHAIDICFKVFFALDGEFPAEARHIWLFIQRCMYKFETRRDYIKDKPLRTFLASHLEDFKMFYNRNNVNVD